jgi:hypothetical protein
MSLRTARAYMDRHIETPIHRQSHLNRQIVPLATILFWRRDAIGHKHDARKNSGGLATQKRATDPLCQLRNLLQPVCMLLDPRAHFGQPSATRLRILIDPFNVPCQHLCSPSSGWAQTSHTGRVSTTPSTVNEHGTSMFARNHPQL